MQWLEKIINVLLSLAARSRRRGGCGCPAEHVGGHEGERGGAQQKVQVCNGSVLSVKSQSILARNPTGQGCGDPDPTGQGCGDPDPHPI